jgi:hypothetical protein
LGAGQRGGVNRILHVAAIYEEQTAVRDQGRETKKGHHHDADVDQRLTL